MLPEHALDNYDSLMVVAHPDDETIWGGNHLLNGKYVVVCITNGNNRTRRKEFAAVIKQTNSIGLMLSFPDKTHGKRNNWESYREEIQQSIDTIVAQKDWGAVELQTAVRTGTLFLRFAYLRRLASLCLRHCSTCVAQIIRGMMI